MTTRMCSNRATMTVTANTASGRTAENPASATTLATRPKMPIGANAMIHSVMRIMTWNTPFHSL